MLQSEKVAKEKADEASYLFFRECAKELAADLPIFKMIVDNCFVATNYALRGEHCRALRTVLERGKGGAQMFDAVHLDNNSIGDAEFASLLSGLLCLANLQKIEYLNNRLGLKSLAILRQIVQRPAPYQLKELVLSECGMTYIENQELFRILSERSALAKLVLHKFQLNQGNIKEL